MHEVRVLHSLCAKDMQNTGLSVENGAVQGGTFDGQVKVYHKKNGFGDGLVQR